MFTPWQRATCISHRALCRLRGAEAHRTYEDYVFWGVGETAKTGPRGLTSSPDKAEGSLSSGDSEHLLFAGAWLWSARAHPVSSQPPALRPSTASGRFLPRSNSQRSPMSPTPTWHAGASSHRRASGARVQKGSALNPRQRTQRSCRKRRRWEGGSRGAGSVCSWSQRWGFVEQMAAYL